MQKEIRWKIKRLVVLMLLCIGMAGCAPQSPPAFSPGELAPYDGEPYIEVNGNIPFFTQEELSAVPFESYSEQDALMRCRTAYACIGRELMPTIERGGIGSVRPTGWHTVKYEGVIGDKYLYNRCHLIAYQLTGENANEKNLITGTRYLNVEGMQPFENRVADYVKETGNHVLYRVTPVFEGENLVASGVLMEAESVEDGGAGILFHVYCYNVQPGIEIDYADGSSRLAEASAAAKEISPAGAYAVNTNNGKIHISGACPATGTGEGAIKNPVYFASYEEAEAYSRQIKPDQQKRQCGNCW